MTTTELLSYLPSSYEEHTNDNTVYNTKGHDYEGNDYSIEITSEWFEVRHTGNTITFDTVEEVLEYIA